ncbi:type II toxin-antitoxin system VapC family toxin [Wenzhouxiangella sp. AB-CW3]|uniref:type II toxin-antitoxin system VapC family toxin n=1 Tax=Wenzhouxiangella sp. AB-CW3 TaxID=2771012 RepID=UPI00168AD248|nr:type II toxin-antitoxin system VapC family toxin [Wenzhouxiangella sp. AB-CW3]QOC21936.1 type II toxin-antitoxin system VapC family toxin [Wenzhouxiangella sp. AB-CW3]
MLYFDTSAVLPYYRQEAASEAVESLLQAQSTPVLISDLVEVEFASALARWVRCGELDEPQAHRIEATFREDLNAGRFSRAPVTGRHFEQAREWLSRRKTALRTLDALHLACAQDCSARLVTLDAALAKAADFWGLDVQNPSSGWQ